MPLGSSIRRSGGVAKRRKAILGDAALGGRGGGGGYPWPLRVVTWVFLSIFPFLVHLSRYQACSDIVLLTQGSCALPFCSLRCLACKSRVAKYAYARTSPTQRLSQLTTQTPLTMVLAAHTGWFGMQSQE